MSLPAASPAIAAPSREEEFVRRILASDDFPAFSRVMSDLMASLKGDEASAQRLANLVLRDYALTVKVIRTANTIHYNRSGRRVQSATHALMLLGASTVRDLACGLLLFEHYRRRSPGLKELMLLSLLTAAHAREAAARRAYADPEAAQLCGMFRNLGEVLVAAHLPVEYTDILRRTKVQRAGGATGPRVSRAQAAFAVLGCSFEDIGCAIAQHWGMPDSVRKGMRAVGAPGEDALESVTAFGHGLATAIYREDDSSSRESVDRVLATFGKRLDVDRDALAAIADAAVSETRETFASARVQLDDLRLTRQIAFALSEAARPLTPEEVEAEVKAGAAPLSKTPVVQQEAVDAPTESAPNAGPALAALRERLAHDLEVAVEDVSHCEMHRAILVALEAALRGGPFDRACFCAADVGKQELRARFGLGSAIEAFIPQLSLPIGPGAQSPGPAIMRGEEVVLTLGTRISLHEAHLLRTWGAASAAFYPVVIDGAAIGAIYVDRRTVAIGLDGPTLSYMRRVASSASRALAVRRHVTPTAAPVAVAAPAVPTPSPVPAPAPPQVPAASRTLSAGERRGLVLRVLRGEAIDSVARDGDVEPNELAAWRDAFLAAAEAAVGDC